MINDKSTRLAKRLNVLSRLLVWLFSSQSDRDIARMQSESRVEVARYKIASWVEEQIAETDRSRERRKEKQAFYGKEPGERWRQWMQDSTSPPTVPPKSDIAILPPTISARVKRTPQRTGNCNQCDVKLVGRKRFFCADLHKSMWWNEENRRRLTI